MDGLKVFAQCLPQLLTMVTLVQQVLAAHGILTGSKWHPMMEDYSSGYGGADTTAWSLEWRWERNGYELSCKFYLDVEDDGDTHVDIWFRLSPINMDGMEVWTSRRPNGDEAWEITGDGMGDRNRALRLNSKYGPLYELWGALPGYDFEDGHSTEATAREAMGMMAAFFASLPEDPPKTAR